VCGFSVSLFAFSFTPLVRLNVSFVCQKNAWTTFRVGFFAGIFIVLVTVAVVCGKCLNIALTSFNVIRLYFAFAESSACFEL